MILRRHGVVKRTPVLGMRPRGLERMKDRKMLCRGQEEDGYEVREGG